MITVPPLFHDRRKSSLGMFGDPEIKINKFSADENRILFHWVKNDRTFTKIVATAVDSLWAAKLAKHLNNDSRKLKF